MKNVLCKISIGLAIWWILGAIIMTIYGETLSDKILGFITFSILSAIHLFLARNYIKLNYSKEIRNVRKRKKEEEFEKIKENKLKEINSINTNKINEIKYTDSKVCDSNDKKQINELRKCPMCGSENVTIQILNEAILKNAHHSIIWWLIIGWWWVFVKWICFTIPALIFKIFGIGKKKKIVNFQKKINVCQNCGNTWNN